MPITTSFVMAALNRREFLANTIEGYRPYAPYDDTELVLVDYGSTDNLESILEPARQVFGRVRYLLMDRSKSTVPINPKFNNPAVALNVAIRGSSAPFLIMSPPECYPLADNIRVAQEIMQRGTLKACLFGKVLGMPRTAAGVLGKDNWFPKTEAEVDKKILLTRFVVWASKQKNILRHVPFFMAFRKEDHEGVNGFDEEFVRGYAGEDTDYTMRLGKLGAKHIWDDRCVVLHQWHDRTEMGPRGTAPGQPNYRRVGLKANPNHQPGSPNMIVKDVVL